MEKNIITYNLLIVKKVLESRNKCVEASHQSFGMVAAAYQVAIKIGLVDILKKISKAVVMEFRVTYFSFLLFLTD